MLLIKVYLTHTDPNVDQVARKTELTLPVFPISAEPRFPVFVCPIMASSGTNYLFDVSNENAGFSPHPVFVCPLRTPQTAHPTPPRNWRALYSRSSPRPFRRDTSVCWDIVTTFMTPIGSQTTTFWTR